MKNIVVAIVDDDEVIIQTLRTYLTQIEGEEGITFATCFFSDGADFIKDYQPMYDIILMDVEMPKLNGLEAAQIIREKDIDTVLIFVTNMAQYALRGYEVDAIDYIIKPVSYYEFYIKIKKAMRFISKIKSKTITIDTVDGFVKVFSSDIYYIEVQKHYLTYHTKKGSFVSRGIFKEIEESLEPFHFARIHKSYLINMTHIGSLKAGTVTVESVELPIGRAYKEDLMQRFARYVGGAKGEI